MSQHAELSASSFFRVMTCAGAVAMSAGKPNSNNEYSDEGTAAHTLAGWCLTDNKDAAAFEGRIIKIVNGDYWPGKPAPFPPRTHGQPRDIEREFEVDDDMVEHVQTYIDNVRAAAAGEPILVEQKVPIEHITGEPGAESTADAIVVHPDLLLVDDLKYGRGRVVEVEDNEQLLGYASGAIEKFGAVQAFDKVRITIHQPRINKEPQSITYTVAEVRAFEVKLRARAELAFSLVGAPMADILPHLNPSDEACFYCKAKSVCPRLRQVIEEATAADFDDLTQTELPKPKLENLYLLGSKLDLIETWVKGVRADIERELFSGEEVKGWKLVMGRKGRRAWADVKAATELMRKKFRMSIEEAFELKLISPTEAEKRLKTEPKRWAQLKDLITQSEGKPSVAPASDKRDAITVDAAADFSDLTADEIA